MFKILIPVAMATVSAVSAPPPSAPLLSEREADEVRTAIDNICGDSWCESDFNFVFDGFGCDFGRQECRLTFRLHPLDRNDLMSKPQICVLGPVDSARDLANWEADGTASSLTESFYEKVDGCLSPAITRRTEELGGQY
jgi:hypothetical protein